MEGKKPSDSYTMMTEIVLPNDTNVYGNLMGGRLMYWMDIAAAIAAQKHCNAPVVTASVDNISFESPIKLGNTVHIEARVSRAFNTSMEVHLKVWGEDFTQQYKYKSNEVMRNLEFGIWIQQVSMKSSIFLILLINPLPNVPFGTGGCEIHIESVKSVINYILEIPAIKKSWL